MATAPPAEPRYQQMNVALSGVNVLGATLITVATMLAAFGDWTTVGWIAAIQFPVIGFNAVINHYAVPRWGLRAEYVRTAVNLGTGLLASQVSHWSFPNWLWQPYVALAFDQFGRRVAVRIVLAFAVVQDAWALFEGVAPIFPIASSAFAYFCWENARIRLFTIRGMVDQADADRLALARAHVELQAEVDARSRAELDLHNAQKLESMGRLAAGIAHEINTPLQYLGDSLRFIGEGSRSALQVVAAVRGEFTAAQAEHRQVDAGTLSRVGEEVDLPWIEENLPLAVDTAVEGVARVASIVRAMRQFVRADAGEPTLVDLNDAVRTTLVVARNEYKLVADVEAVLPETLPPVSGHPGELNQVLLDLVVHAAQAVGESARADGRKGTIRLETSADVAGVLLAVSDTGPAIPGELADRLFEPFSTVRPAGVGTGRDLAIARAIVGRHGGKMWFTSESGRGTTFFVQLPPAQPPMG